MLLLNIEWIIWKTSWRIFPRMHVKWREKEKTTRESTKCERQNGEPTYVKCVYFLQSGIYSGINIINFIILNSKRK